MVRSAPLTLPQPRYSLSSRRKSAVAESAHVWTFEELGNLPATGCSFSLSTLPLYRGPNGGRMIQRRRVRVWAITSIATIFSLVFAWPLWGALRSVTWPDVMVDRAGPDKVVKDHFIDMLPNIATDVDIFPETPFLSRDGRNCYHDIWPIASNRFRDRPFNAILKSIHVFRNGADNLDIEAAEMASLSLLPRPVLGALGGCVDGSLAAGICLSYIDKRLRRAVTNTKPGILAKHRQNALDLQDMSCILLDGINPARKS